MDHLVKFDILSDKQHGYRNGSSTETQLLKVIDLFAKSYKLMQFSLIFHALSMLYHMRDSYSK